MTLHDAHTCRGCCNLWKPSKRKWNNWLLRGWEVFLSMSCIIGSNLLLYTYFTQVFPFFILNSCTPVKSQQVCPQKQFIINCVLFILHFCAVAALSIEHCGCLMSSYFVCPEQVLTVVGVCQRMEHEPSGWRPHQLAAPWLVTTQESSIIGGTNQTLS